MYLQKTIKEYLSELSARQPTPGGGSAAALCGAMGVALLEMVLNFTIGKERFKDFEDEAREILTNLEKARLELEGLIDEDVSAYKEIVSAYKSKDKNLIDKALKNGYDISFRICNATLNAAGFILRIKENANLNLITDVGAGAEFLNAAFRSAILNIEINLKDIEDRDFVEQAEMKKKSCFEEFDRIYQKMRF